MVGEESWNYKCSKAGPVIGQPERGPIKFYFH